MNNIIKLHLTNQLSSVYDLNLRYCSIPELWLQRYK